jgi:hypothetical protein
MKTLRKVLLIVGGLMMLAGCTSPQARIRQKPEIFNRLTAEQQAMIREGKVGVGFDKEMVRLALGEPDRVRERTDATGTTEVWNYVTYEANDGMLLYSGMYHRYWGDSFYPYYLSYPSYRARAHTVVMFREGKVTVVETRKQGRD